MRTSRVPATVALVVALLSSSCAGSDAPTRPATIAPELAARLDALREALVHWSGASTLPEAQRAAEQAANLVTGPGAPVGGDLDSDGTVQGSVTEGLLPAAPGTLGLPLPDNPCVARDVLGGSWNDPVRRWHELAQRIATWSEENNTFPALPSHPQRLVGWATLTARTDSLETAREFAGHARLHFDALVTAVTHCTA